MCVCVRERERKRERERERETLGKLEEVKNYAHQGESSLSLSSFVLDLFS